MIGRIARCAAVGAALFAAARRRQTNCGRDRETALNRTEIRMPADRSSLRLASCRPIRAGQDPL